MGGDLFGGAQKLSQEQYDQITNQLIQKIQPFCKKIQPYISLPEKQIHGDIDFVILAENTQVIQKIIQTLSPQKYRISHSDQTLNIVYKNKQVDFVMVKTQKQFDLMLFYKSYSGFGGYLGVFFPSKILKVTHKGLFSTIIHFHLKKQFLVSDSVEDIMRFYGLDQERHQKGYKTKKQLYQYLRKVRFLDQQKYVDEVKLIKGTSKLMWGMALYLKQNGINKLKQVVHFKDPLKQILEFFKKTEQFEAAHQQLLDRKKRQQQLSKKFNAVHMLAQFDIVPKQVDKLKEKFIQLKFQNDKQKYLDFVEGHTLEQLLKTFGQVCELKTKQQAKKNIQN